MPNDLLERPKGNEYDDDAGWYHGEGSDDPHGDLMNTSLDDLDDLPTAGDDDLPDGHPSKSKKKKSLDGDDIANAEAGTGDKNTPSAAPAMAGESAMAGAADTLGKGFTGAGAASSAAKLLFSKKSTKVGGGIAGAGIIGIIFTSFFASSLYLVHLKEMATGKANHFASLRNTAFEKRRGKTLVKYISSKHANKVFLDSFETKASSAGITVVKDEATGKITKLVSTESNKVVAEFDNGLTKKGFGQFMETEAGRAFADDIDSIAPSLASEWRGIAAKKNFLTRLKVSMVNIFDRASPDPDAPPRERVDLALANADETEKARFEQIKAQEQLARDNNVTIDPNADPTQQQNGVGQVAVDENTQQLVDKVNTEVGTNPSILNTVVDGASNEVLDAFGEGASAAASAGDTIAFGTILKELSSNLAKRGASLILGAINALAIPQYGCKLVGTVNFLSNTKSVLLAYELAKFTTRIMVSGSEQQAGIVKSESAKLAALAMSGATSSGGMRWMAGDSSAKVSAVNLDKYSPAGNPTGMSASIKKFANSIPGVNNKNTCKFVNNGIIAAAGIAIGVVAFIFGGSESGASESNAIFATGLQVAVDLAFAIVTPQLVRMITHQVMTAVTDNLSVGDAFAAGAGALGASNSSANGARIITQPKAALLQRETESYRKIELARTSVFDKYFNMERGDSLVHQLAFASPSGSAKDMFLSTTTLAGRMTNLFSNPIAQVASALSSKNSKAYAAIGSDQCDDPYLKSLDVVTDPFCNPLVADVPNLDLDRTETALAQAGEIDGDGNPVVGSEFDAYIKNCLSGRSALLYKENVSRDGNDGSGEDKACIEEGTALAGDFPETIYAMRDTEKPSLWDKITGNSHAFAAPEDETRTPGRNERYALWYGYLIDSQNLEEDITGSYSDEVNATGPVGGTAPIVPTGSATIGSFKNPSITYDKANITLPNCNFTGAQPAGAVRGEQPGAKELQKLINTRYGQGGTGYIFNCRDVSGPSTAPSVHGTGRAVDSFFNALDATELQKGNDALGWLVANAELFGIQYAKFWRVQWTPNKGFTCVTTKDDQITHSTHVHFEVNWDGALRKTPYFTGTPFSESGISVSQDICPRL